MPNRSVFARICTLAVIVLLFVGTAGRVQAQDLGNLALGAALDKLADELDQAVIDARNSGQSVEIEAGRQASIAISEAKNAYADSLDTTVKTLDPTIRNTVDQLQQLVNSVSTNAFQTVDEATSRAQQIVNALPFRNNQPQVRTILPRFVVPSDHSYPVTIRVSGNFIDAARDGYTPYVTIGSNRYTPIESTTQDLAFQIPVQGLFIGAAPDPAKFNFAHLTLSVPWRESRWLGLWHDDHTDKYRIIIGALPSSPGKIVIIHTVQDVTTETKTFTSNNFHICSTRECGNNDQKDVAFQVRPEDGWHVVRGTSHAGVGSRQGDTSGPDFVSDDGDQVTYKATTIHHGFGSSGSIDFSISFQETRTVTTPKDVPDTVSILWGDSKVFTFPAGSWKVLFDSFDGHHNEFAGTEDSNHLLRIDNQQGSIVIATQDPASLQWP